MGYFIYSGDVEELEGHAPFGDGECVALPKETTSVGWTGFWRPGPRVVDLYYLNPGAVIANFVIDSQGRGRFPNRHRYHAALFIGFRRGVSGKVTSIEVMDQWVGAPVRRRDKRAYSADEAKRYGIAPADNANEFYVVVKA